MFTIVFYAFIFVVVVQLLFYGLIFSKFSFAKDKRPSKKNIGVSVLVCAKNEADNLKEFIPSILNQDFPQFEVILINDASTDDTLYVMKEFESQNKNVKIVDVAHNEAFWGSKKYALTLGIKASTYNFLLFTDADCKPLSKNWIRTMSSHFSNQKTIVIGYGAYKKIRKSFLNLLIRFETLLTATQYFSYAKIGVPYMAVGRNLAYRKEEFFNANGFTNHMQIRSGDDDLFVNQIASFNNTALSYSKDSFTESIPEQSFKAWFQQKKRHVSTSKYYKSKHQFMLGLFYTSQLLFWLFFVVLLVSTFQWKIVLAIGLFRCLVVGFVLFFSSKKLNESDLLLSFPFLEIFLVLLQLVIFISNLTTKSRNWR